MKNAFAALHGVVAFSLVASVGCAGTTGPTVVSAPSLSTSAALAPSRAARAAPHAPTLFVGQNDTVCAMLGGALTCSTGLRLPPDAVGVATSLMHYCAWTSAGQAYCAGYNKDGRVGTGARSDHEELTPVPGLANVAHVAVAARSTCAVTTDGAVWCWGD